MFIRQAVSTGKAKRNRQAWGDSLFEPVSSGLLGGGGCSTQQNASQKQFEEHEETAWSLKIFFFC